MLNRASEHSKVWKHYNVFYREPGTVTGMNCRVCGTMCIEERNVAVSKRWSGASIRDRFTCPYNNEDWHWRALAMVQELEDTSSPSLRAIIQQDIDDAVYDGLKK